MVCQGLFIIQYPILPQDMVFQGLLIIQIQDMECHILPQFIILPLGMACQNR